MSVAEMAVAARGQCLRWGLPLALAAVLVLLGPVVVAHPAIVIAITAGLVIFLAAFVHPPVAAYALIGITPLIAGMSRGAAFSLLRLTEVLTLLAGGAVVARRVLGVAGGAPLRPRLRTTDASILFLVVSGSVVPLLWLLARGKDVTQDDVLYSFQLLKYYGVYVVVRASVQSEDQVRRCLLLSVAAATAVAVVGILQALQLLGVPQLLANHWTPTEEELLTAKRATSTLGHTFAMADLMVFNLGIIGGWLAKGKRRTAPLLAVGALMVVGTLASGQFSGALALLTGLLAVGLVTGHLRRVLLAASPVLVVAGLLLQPVIATRLSEFSTQEGIPDSWTGRWENLTTYVWPRLSEDFSYVLGVRPSPRVPIMEGSSEFVYIESGHTWLLWVGGLPLLAAFLLFLWTNLRATGRIARHRSDSIGVAATTSFVSLSVVAVLTTLDPHLTLRGSADVLFALLGLAYVGVGTKQKRHLPGRAAAPTARLHDP